MTGADQQLFLWINAASGTPGWVILAARVICDGLPVLAAIALAVVAVLRPDWRRTALATAAAVALVWISVRWFRATFPMPRPAQMGLGIQWIAHGVRPGFPSMHAAIVGAMVGGLLAGRRYTAALLMAVLAVLVDLSRVVLGVHFPSDVLAGTVFGVFVGWMLVKPWRGDRASNRSGPDRSGVGTQVPDFFSRGTRPIK